MMLLREKNYGGHRGQKSIGFKLVIKTPKFFTSKLLKEKRKNTIKSIQHNDDRRWTDANNISSTFIDYFKNIFTSSNPNCMQETINVVKYRINPELHTYLQQDFRALEVYEAIKQMKSTSAPGPDGLHAFFYQSYWSIIGSDVIHYVLNILNNHGDLGNINHTFLCIIPKIKHPNLPSDYRPIALCNVILKIVTKTIANIIKPILPIIISPQQSAFIPKRLISDNTILAYEAFHFFKNHKNKKNGVVGIKLDMEKAYDRVE